MPPHFQPFCRVAATYLARRYRRIFFPFWARLLRDGFNVLTYGPGSKRKVLADFSRRCTGRGETVVVNGHSPHTNLKSILSEVMETTAPLYIGQNTSAVRLSLLGQCHHIKDIFNGKPDFAALPYKVVPDCWFGKEVLIFLTRQLAW